MDATDAELLAAFARNRSEDAFRELLRRHLGMVFATARRLVGDAHEAEEIAQTVFQLFAEKAGTIGAGQPLAGWLYHATRHHALHRVRSEGRRRQREQLAADMNPATEAALPPPLLAELEDALTELDAEERDALVLRFLEDRQLREVGRELGVSEEAARKRVSRALDHLREVFGRKGITASTGAITVALLGQAGVGVPATLGASITTTVLGGTAVAAATTALITETTATTMNLFNLKTAAAILGTAAVTGTTTYLVQEREVVELQSEQATINKARERLTSEHQQAMALIQLRDEQLSALRKEVEELPRLRGEVDTLGRKIAEVEAIRRENLRLEAELKHALQSKNQNATHNTASPGMLITKDKLAFVGFGTPEAALQSMTWAMLFGTYDQAVSALSPELLAAELRDPRERERFRERQLTLTPMWESMQIVAKKSISPTQVELKVRQQYAPEFQPRGSLSPYFVQPMVYVDGSWKIGGSTRDYEGTWEQDGSIESLALDP